MTLILNILWFIFGGWAAGLAWLFAGVLLAVTIVGLPWTQAAFRIGLFSFMPFGKQVVSRRAMTGREDLGTGPMGLILNIVWFVLGGWYIALAHLVIGVVQLVLIITIPFGLQHLKLAASGAQCHRGELSHQKGYGHGSGADRGIHKRRRLIVSAREPHRIHNHAH